MSADDLVQDTLERAWTKQRLWSSGSDLRAWLFTIMHNVFINQVRSRGLAPTESLNEEMHDLQTPGTQGDLLEVRDIDAALRMLPEEQREVLVLMALEQLSYEQAAGILNIPMGTVMSRLSRARERFRVLLANSRAATPLKVVK